MNGIEVLKASLAGTQYVLKWFVDDFSDAELLVRPVPTANHAAWQIGNVIAGDVSHYMFADDIHPTPYEYSLVARYVLEQMVERGWL